jgi:hypothetical protein
LFERPSESNDEILSQYRRIQSVTCLVLAKSIEDKVLRPQDLFKTHEMHTESIWQLTQMMMTLSLLIKIQRATEDYQTFVKLKGNSMTLSENPFGASIHTAKSNSIHTGSKGCKY